MEKFVADSMLGKLARWLRIAGYDVEYFKERDMDRLLRVSYEDKRTILTRDKKMGGLNSVFIIESEHFEDQLREFFKKYPVLPIEKSLSRCILCNKVLKEADPKDVKDLVPPHVYEVQNRFFYCPKCGRIYWAGSHYKRMKQKLMEIYNSLFTL